MGNNVSTNGLGRILGKAHPIGIGHDLVGDEDSDSKFFGQSSQLSQELCHLHLTFRQLSPTGIVRPIEGRG